MIKICINCWYCVSYNGKYVCDLTDKQVDKDHTCKKYNSGDL